ncbi:metG [Wigglesworthia glossinidia endosymbiont of Glossina brevipalpis]|uniref:Methionine--tRNA ligase n=1 Tax=Wigglesworthia glossinidia brevipalpis TaxID=36870 RepID=SYM_WIGBR|nr:RecName: Full=Methionine--tRNA ligase; AltName: Full=Methionyl-tRNA synthetase; Short=MetRS [Wigglesworthia glossinidia endosymbiont of Glossina brevipalpis]BAC24682.1 metG [Wigglesworthia glossinidia endosymbiont of Glossina brevipalpis]
MQNRKKILTTCAFPYANGSLHIGHILEHIQADIWVRFNRMIGNEIYFICADDSHGTPIMIKAKKNKISPEKMVFLFYKEHKNDLSKFNISYDNYYLTHSKENYRFCKLIYKLLKRKKLIFSKYISQFYDCKINMFLSDRLIQGKCPECNSEKQYSDNCNICGANYCSTDVINPISILSKSVPIIKKSKHLFFDLPKFEKFLKKWIHSGVLKKENLRKVSEWFKNGLKPWDISRDAPYFGFKIPNEKEKYFYVWLDAPIGYLSTFKNLCDKKEKIFFSEFWDVNSKSEIYQFIGKDVIYFHSLFWPAILHGINLKKPTKLFVHGHVTLNGEKMSKSNGFVIKAKTYLKYCDSDFLRYYFSMKISSCAKDIDFSLSDFMNKVNSNIINKIVNLASRSSSFIDKYFEGYLSYKIENYELYCKFTSLKEKINKYFQSNNISFIIYEIIKLAELANQYFNKKSPWKLTEESKDKRNKLHEISSMGINMFYIIMIYLKPILPNLSKKTEDFLNISLKWENINKPLLYPHLINKFKPLCNRITKSQINYIKRESTIK